MKRLFIIAFLIMVFVNTYAIPARRKPFTAKQSDGTTLTLVLNGDENLHYHSTLDGVPVKESDGTYYYAVIKDNVLTASNIIAHDSSRRTEAENAFVNEHKSYVIGELSRTWGEKLKKRNAARITKGRVQSQSENATSETKTRREFGLPTSYTGKKQGLVILVNFKNLSMRSSHTQDAFSQMFNKEGYNLNGHIGSVHDYFYDQSYGKFDLNFDVVGPVKVSQTYSYYGKNDDNGSDMYPCKLVIEACKLADNLGVDFSKYDWDGDGNVEQVYLIYAGQGEAYGGLASTIWPHEYQLSYGVTYGDGTGALKLDGVTIDTYAMSSELITGSAFTTIGTACHEFSHCLGLPDLYDTNYSGGFGMGYWDLLDAGSYNGPELNGEIPCGYSAYERWFAGWLDFTELKSPCDVVNAPAICDKPTAYIIYNDANHDEYFTLENRQNKKWFEYVSNVANIHGMLVSHVDYDYQTWMDNLVNNTSTHQRLSLIPADGSYGVKRTSGGQTYYVSDETDLAGDLFPGYEGVTSLTNTSHKSVGGKLFNKNTDDTYYMNKPITDITEKDGLISFKFMGGEALDIQKINSVEQSAVTYYTLSGNILQGRPTTSGIYLMKQGSATKKIQIK